MNTYRHRGEVLRDGGFGRPRAVYRGRPSRVPGAQYAQRPPGCEGGAVIFRFDHRWRLDAAPDAVFAALADVDRYVEWWPQVRRSRRLDERSGVTVIRSVLPVPLRLVLTRRVEDTATGVLEVELAGDLVGWSRFTVDADGARYEQECVLGRPWLDRLAARPGAAALLRANHAWMMRCGERGLRRRLQGPSA